ncbi:helix-hairpin-helix domain-containing protein [Methanosarcina horonobensis]|uniref:helix-hairpin-helix domain-containing protein n=1 Tax=Methanosarcina horonobensis TaxID=418008 RepID=UPI000A7553F0|nr:helix-hairpin-helix domain-containing protein [Methanosarcina horonobensis]
MEIRGLGAKKMKKLADELEIKTISDLKDAVSTHRLRRLEGFGEKSEENIARAIENYEKKATPEFHLEKHFRLPKKSYLP